MKRLLPLFFVIILPTACEYNDIGPRATVFTFTVPVYPNSFGTPDSWIIVHDGETGKLLSSKKIEGAEPVELRTTEKLSGDKISVTHLRMGNTAFWTRFVEAYVYNGVDVGSNWVVTNPDKGGRVGTDNSVAGWYDLTINNSPAPYGFVVSSAFRYSNTGDNKSGRMKGQFDLFNNPTGNLLWSTKMDRRNQSIHGSIM